MKIPKDLENKHREANAAIDTWVKENIPLGTEVIHKHGHYKGRKAVVSSAVWFGDDHGSTLYTVKVLVKTYALRGKDKFVSKYQHGQNMYASFDDFYIRVKKEA